MADKYLDKAYATRGFEDTRVFYNAWSSSYEDEIGENGYATPSRAAKALATHLGDTSAPILDFGCGTGLCGVALTAVGYNIIDGMDLSGEMLVQAAQKQAYRNLSVTDPNRPLSIGKGVYSAITAIGVLGAGAAPISLLDTLMGVLAPGGMLVFSLNDHALADNRSQGRVNEQIDTGFARLLHCKHGPHLPGIKLKSTIYILEKT